MSTSMPIATAPEAMMATGYSRSTVPLKTTIESRFVTVSPSLSWRRGDKRLLTGENIHVYSNMQKRAYAAFSSVGVGDELDASNVRDQGAAPPNSRESKAARNRRPLAGPRVDCHPDLRIPPR